MANTGRLRLGVNIDHVATVRNARGAQSPDPLRAAILAEASGADAITAHLREDRRHIRDADVEALRAGIGIPLNLECAPTEEMQGHLLRLRPQACCLAADRDTGGLDPAEDEPRLRAFVAPLRQAGIRVALSVPPEAARIEAAARSGAAIVELHAGRYAALEAEGRQTEADEALEDLARAAARAAALGLEVQAGHGLTYENVEPVAALPDLSQLNLGHFLIGEAIVRGLGPAIEEMRRRMDVARGLA